MACSKQQTEKPKRKRTKYRDRPHPTYYDMTVGAEMFHGRGYHDYLPDGVPLNYEGIVLMRIFMEAGHDTVYETQLKEETKELNWFKINLALLYLVKHGLIHTNNKHMNAALDALEGGTVPYFEMNRAMYDDPAYGDDDGDDLLA